MGLKSSLPATPKPGKVPAPLGLAGLLLVGNITGPFPSFKVPFPSVFWSQLPTSPFLLGVPNSLEESPGLLLGHLLHPPSVPPVPILTLSLSVPTDGPGPASLPGCPGGGWPLSRRSGAANSLRPALPTRPGSPRALLLRTAPRVVQRCCPWGVRSPRGEFLREGGRLKIVARGAGPFSFSFGPCMLPHSGLRGGQEGPFLGLLVSPSLRPSTTPSPSLCHREPRGRKGPELKGFCSGEYPGSRAGKPPALLSAKCLTGRAGQRASAQTPQYVSYYFTAPSHLVQSGSINAGSGGWSGRLRPRKLAPLPALPAGWVAGTAAGRETELQEGGDDPPDRLLESPASARRPAGRVPGGVGSLRPTLFSPAAAPV